MDTRGRGEEPVGPPAAWGRLAARPPLADDVYDVVIDMLMHHALAPGSRLNIDELSRTLGLSPTPIREALARVESEGLILKEPRRGYVVAPLIGTDELRELIELRLLIEPACAADAARSVDPSQATTLRAFARSGGAGDSSGAANRLDMTYDATFHDMIARLGGNRLRCETLARLRSHLHMYRLYHHAHHTAATKPEHVAIAKAIGRRDADAAHAAMTHHLETALQRLNAVFASGSIAVDGAR